MAYQYPIKPSKEALEVYCFIKKHLDDIIANKNEVTKICLPNLYSTPTANDITGRYGDNAYIKNNVLYVNVHSSIYLKVEISNICLMPTNILVMSNHDNISVDIRSRKLFDNGIIFSFEKMESFRLSRFQVTSMKHSIYPIIHHTYI